MPSDDPFVIAMRKWFETLMRHSTQDFVLNLKKKGLSMPQIGTLMQIHRGTAGVSEVGEELGVTSAAASQMLERLVQLRLVLRTEDPTDRRVKRLVLTDKGQRTIQEVVQARQRWLDDLMHSLSNSEKEQITAALNLLIEKIEKAEQLATSDEPKHE
jgi:DNA-binding MarR family transcriptional regulator